MQHPAHTNAILTGSRDLGLCSPFLGGWLAGGTVKPSGGERGECQCLHCPSLHVHKEYTQICIQLSSTRRLLAASLLQPRPRVSAILTAVPMPGSKTPVEQGEHTLPHPKGLALPTVGNKPTASSQHLHFTSPAWGPNTAHPALARKQQPSLLEENTSTAK